MLNFSIKKLVLTWSLTLPGLAPTLGRISGPAERSEQPLLGGEIPRRGSREGGRATSRKVTLPGLAPTARPDFRSELRGRRRSPGGGSREGGRATSRNLYKYNLKPLTKMNEDIGNKN
eukprot:6718286-Pyramimonas_sp.AAC.1